MAYTIHQIDTAIRAIVGEFAGNVRLNASRPHAMNDAAARAWIDERPEDEHSAALREGLQDLTKLGHLNPIDGVFPDDR